MCLNRENAHDVSHTALWFWPNRSTSFSPKIAELPLQNCTYPNELKMRTMKENKNFNGLERLSDHHNILITSAHELVFTLLIDFLVLFLCFLALLFFLLWRLLRRASMFLLDFQTPQSICCFIRSRILLFRRAHSKQFAHFFCCILKCILEVLGIWRYVGEGKDRTYSCLLKTRNESNRVRD